MGQGAWPQSWPCVIPGCSSWAPWWSWIVAKKVSGSQEVPVMGEIWRNHGEAGCYWMLLDVTGCYWMWMMLIVGYWMLLVLTWDVLFLYMFGTLDVRPRLRPDSWWSRSCDQNCSAGCKTPHVGQILKRNPLNPDMLNLPPSYSERYESQFVIGSLYMSVYIYIYIYINEVHVFWIYIYILVYQ